MIKKSVSYITVTENEDGQRLDNYLTSRLKGVPRSALYKIIRKGEVRVNKGRAKPERKLCSGDVVRVPPMQVTEVEIPKAPSRKLSGLLDSAVLYDQDGLMIVNKPNGLAVHGGSGVNLGMIEALRQMQDQPRFLELVHRLDRDTSGCVMVARKRSVLKHLQDALRERQRITKKYLAIVQGVWPKDVKSVDAPLKRLVSPSNERIVKVHPEGKESLTRFKLIEQFEQGALVEASPITGRTHQIRVHALHVGCPLFGDDKYGETDLNNKLNEVLKKHGGGRLFLHAASLTIKREDEPDLVVEAPLPESFERCLKILKNFKPQSVR